MSQLYNLQFRTKMKSEGSGIQYFTQIWLKDGKNINQLVASLNEMLANNAKVGVSEAIIRPSDGDIELPENQPVVNEQIISLGWRGKTDETVFTSVRIPCLGQGITTDALNALLTEYVCAAPTDSTNGVSGSDTPIDSAYVWQNSRAVRYVSAAQGASQGS